MCNRVLRGRKDVNSASNIQYIIDELNNQNTYCLHTMRDLVRFQKTFAKGMEIIDDKLSVIATHTLTHRSNLVQILAHQAKEAGYPEHLLLPLREAY